MQTEVMEEVLNRMGIEEHWAEVETLPLVENLKTLKQAHGQNG